MKLMRLFVSIVSFTVLIASTGWSDTKTVVLQNSDTYKGCSDAFISSQSSSATGGAENLNFYYEQCSS